MFSPFVSRRGNIMTNLFYRVIGSMPAGIDDGDTLLADVDVIWIIGVADTVRIRACEHRVGVCLAWRHPWKVTLSSSGCDAMISSERF
jgi:hypothetical protein